MIIYSNRRRGFSASRLQFLMSGKLNKEQQVQVVIRIKPPHNDPHACKSVYLSDDQDKTLVVETPNKKEFFVFDNIADEHSTQQELYQYIGQDAVKSSTQGFNCCIFAYGQTGAGKTYSILGDTQRLNSDFYCEDRGILPRLLADVFSCCESEADRYWIKCSYMEIYNEQIFDLLNCEQKLRQIREDFKKGVFVEGLSEEHATNYQEAMSILMKGIKNRKISSTSMNAESSRSHTIFTVYIETEFKDGESLKVRRSKIHIVDLAGSERAKLTKVEGDRLKEGCNINKSLHVLGNVINALVESSKRKKHIPFRDSKLTHFLKDSLCGNSITKLLANVHSSKSYLSDTLSTLMFAKRAKILKMKIQANENTTENFEDLRKEIRKLREELAEARYLKNESKLTQRNMTESDQQLPTFQKIIDTSNFDFTKNESALQVFEENETNYKALIQIYEEHYKVCGQSGKTKRSVNIHQQLKNMEKKNAAYQNLLKNVPAFTKIFKENLVLRNEVEAGDKKGAEKKQKPNLQVENNEEITISIIENSITRQKVNQVRKEYEELIKCIQKKFTTYINQIQEAYEELQSENKAKEERIKELRKRKQLPPDLEELTNQNEYLKLNIMELEDQISNLEDKERKYQIQIKQLKKDISSHPLRESGNLKDLEEADAEVLGEKLQAIQDQLEKEVREFQEQRSSMIDVINKLKARCIELLQEAKSNEGELDVLRQENRSLKKKLNQLLKIQEIEIGKDSNNNTNTFWTNEESNFSEDLDLFNQKRNNQEKTKWQGILEKEQLLRQKLQAENKEQREKAAELSSQIIKLHQSYNDEIFRLRSELRELEAIQKQLRDENYQITAKNRKTDELEVPFPEKQHAYGLTHVKSQKVLSRLKQPDHQEQLNRVRRDKQKSEIGKKGVGSLKKTGMLKIKEDEKPPRKGTN